MKKILSAIVLLAVCLLAFASCGETKVGVADFENAMTNTNPTKVTITTTTADANGELKGNFVANFAEDGSSVIQYKYEKWLSLDEGTADELKKVYEGTVNCDANGNYTGGDLTGVVEVSNTVAMNLRAITSTVTVSEDGKTLSATVAAADTQAVFGTAYSYDVNLVITKGATAIETVSISFENGGTTAEIFAKYE